MREKRLYVAWARRSFCGCAALKLAKRSFLVTMAIMIGEQKGRSCRKLGAQSSVEDWKLQPTGTGRYGGGGRAVGTLYLAGTDQIPTGSARVRGTAKVKGRGPLST